MKKFLFLMAFSFLLAACNSEETSNQNDNQESVEETNQGDANDFTENITEGHWISYDGSSPVNEDFAYTDKISYDPEANYTINHFSYISYFSGDEFLETKKITTPYPKEIESVEDADNIKISFQIENMESIELVQE